MVYAETSAHNYNFLIMQWRSVDLCFLKVCKVVLCYGDKLLISLKFLPVEWLFQEEIVDKRKSHKEKYEEYGGWLFVV